MPRVPIDLDRAVRQHEELERRLAACGCRVERVPPAPDCPDSVFVEDTAVVLDELAAATRPGAPARRPEVAAVADALGAYRPVAWIRPPGTLDGGDVLRVGRTLYVGLSARTNREGAAQLERLAACGIATLPVDVSELAKAEGGITCCALVFEVADDVGAG